MLVTYDGNICFVVNIVHQVVPIAVTMNNPRFGYKFLFCELSHSVSYLFIECFQQLKGVFSRGEVAENWGCVS